jgi:hypothetical protein
MLKPKSAQESLFPEMIRIKINNQDTWQKLPYIAVFIKLFATRKNDYFFSYQ